MALRVHGQRRWWWLAALIATVAIAIAVASQTFRRGYNSAFLDATWTAQPGMFQRGVTGRITGWNGRPEVGQQVQVQGDGKVLTAVTGDDGRFGFPMTVDPSRLVIVGIDEVPLTRWNRPKDSLLTFEIHLKRPPPPSRGPL